MKILVVYYSLDGNTKFIARSIADAVGADILELQPKKDLNPKSFMKYFLGGRQVFTKDRPELRDFDKNVQDYDCLFIGTPVWAWTYAPALATFFDSVDLKDKTIALFCCSGGGKGDTFKKMRARLEGNRFIGEIDFIEPLRQNRARSAEVVSEWARRIT